MIQGGGDWRLLLDRPADGAWNMAIDEALLESYSGALDDRPPTLRLYGWCPPALSLGRGQSAPDAVGLGYLRRHRIDLVRRPTGGGAVLHDDERTYAVVGVLRAGPFPGGVLDTYARIARALERAFRALGIDASPEMPGRTAAAVRPAVCFDTSSAHELTWRGKKLVGSAQLRRRRGFLQHGAIPARSEAARVGRVVGPVAHGDRHGGLAEVLGDRPADSVLDAALADAFSREFDTTLRPGALTAAETERATRLRASKYLSARWTLRGEG